MSARAIHEILADLDAANLRLEDSRRNEASARSAATDALNSVNRLQKEIDAAIDAQRMASPIGTDWKARFLGRGQPVEA